MDRLATLLSSLTMDGDQLEVLEAVRPAIGSLSREELRSGLAGREVDLVPLFDCLHRSGPEVCRAGCEVLERLLGATDPALVLQRYSALLVRGLQHPEPGVRGLAIGQIHRAAQDEELAGEVVSLELVPPTLALLAGDLGVATQVTALVVTLADAPAGLRALASPPTVAQLQALMAANSEVQLRVLDLLVQVCTLSEHHLTTLAAVHLLSPLPALLSTADPLSTLAAVELLVTLALPPHGYRYLESSGLLAGMVRLLEDAANSPLASAILPGVLKFFGHLAHARPRQVVTQYPTFLTHLSSMAHSPDPALALAALEAVAHVAASVEGKLTLAELGNRLTDCIDRLEVLLRDSAAEARVRALLALAALVRLDREDQTEELLGIAEGWYRRLPATTARLAEIVKQPFPDLRLAAFQLLQVLAGQRWGRREVLGCPGMVESLMDRRVEQEMEGKVARWRVVEALVESGEVREVVGEQVDMAMRLHVRQGPLYVQVQSQVATEGE